MSTAVIYTRGGDQGMTSLLDGTRVKKYDLRVESYGTVDELNSQIGFARNFLENDVMSGRLRDAQRDLFGVAGELADPSGKYTAGFTDATVKKLEDWIDEAIKLYDPAPKFIVPGSNNASGALHIARTVCRRAERFIVALNDRSPVNPVLIRYINRLSDLLYTYARYAEECQDTV
ncbi:MAG: cob(I)yrinic acid a,c-diamide adenosyltransferase [Acidaminococcales bacterium]|jgi:cob(I)alamin adenosyltransferase|nr:cob(I)yrinic acid a,c-diamide adenosyltransferase [Acidaminococcales bacterium]